MTALNSSVSTIDNSAQSIQLSNNTGLMWQTASSETAAIGSDSVCLSPASGNSPQGHEFQVVPLDVLIASPADPLHHKCENCKLQNVALNGTNLQGWDLSGADFSGATLNKVKLDDAALAGAKFTSATFSCVDFSGTNQNHVTDLTQSGLTKAQFLQIAACPGAVAYTRLSTQAQPFDFTGMAVAGISLQGAILDYATGLAGADLTQIALSNASLQHVNLSGARLYGAQLNNANLDGANLSGATLIKPPSGSGGAANLSGAFLRNVNLTKAQLDGANFTDASFYGTTAAGTGTCLPDPTSGFTNGCATASGATMNNTQFGGAYLFGVDFTNTQIQGVQFSNAVLVGANFAGANLLVDSSVGTNSGFIGAFLQGTNLATAASLTGISLDTAFVDFSTPSNVLYLNLNGQHTVFPGYWNAPGETVCAEMSYNGPSNVPTGNPSITCPNGAQYANGCGPANPDGSNVNWKSQVDITQFASYQFDSTYTPAAANPICAPDAGWADLNLSVPGPGHHKPKPKYPKPSPHK